MVVILTPGYRRVARGWYTGKETLWYIRVYSLLFILGSEYRPVPLEVKIMPVHKTDKTRDNMFMYERNLTYKLPQIIDQYSDGKSVLVFCAARKVCITIISSLIDQDHGVRCQVPDG